MAKKKHGSGLSALYDDGVGDGAIKFGDERLDMDAAAEEAAQPL